MDKLLRAAGLSVLLLGMGAAISGCETHKDMDITKIGLESEPPEMLYNQGLANLKAGKATEAIHKFEAVDRQNPFSEWSRKALVMSTFVNYRSGAFTDAITAGQRYLSQYPDSADSGYVQYLIGLSYAKQIPDVTQDQTAAAKTVEAMTKVVEKYPKSEYVPDAQAKMRFARDNLAGREMQIGRYYLERKEYLASVSRFRTVVERYPNTNQVEEALARLVEAYYAMGIVQEAQAAASVLGKNYPDSQWYKDSYALLKTGGLEPRENSGSWLSQAAKQIGLGDKS